MSIEGHLQIQLTCANAGVSGVSIQSSRPVHASRVFDGKSLAQAQQLLPLLFSICSTAQACAGVRAGEQALGLAVAQASQNLRESLVSLEALREHLWRMLLDWPGFLGRSADKAAMVEMVAIERDYRRLLCQGGDPLQLGGLACTPDRQALQGIMSQLRRLLQDKVFGMPPGQWLSLQEPAALEAWLASGQTIAAQLIDWIRQNHWSSAGACESQPLPPMLEAQLHEALQDDSFIEQPQWAGRCCESTSLTRMKTPLLSLLQARHGNGLLVRLVARLTEVAHLFEHLLPAPDQAGAAASPGMPVNPGIGQALAARGQLVHRVRLEGEVIAGYQILAPTEWNFHPQGVVADALGGLRGDVAAVETQARLLVNSVDPCVGYTLNLVRG